MPAAQLADLAWFKKNSPQGSFSRGTYHTVGTKKPNAWGLFDMLGNVMEWTLDQYGPIHRRRSRIPRCRRRPRIRTRCAADRGTTTKQR